MADAEAYPAGDSPLRRTATIVDVKSGSPAWRVNVAMCAHRFFGIVHDPEVAAAIGKSLPTPEAAAADGPPKSLPFDPWSVYDFSRYLDTLGLPGANNAVVLTKLLGEMERAGLLWLVGREPGLPIMAERYVAPGQISKGQSAGNLWLSPVFGAELIIPSYNAVTIRLAGHDDDGNPTDRWGTGLIIDHQHIITNKHVISGLAETSTGMSIYPRRDDPDARRVDCSGTGAAHATIDVAVIRCELPDGQFIPHLAGMAFRDPDWSDEVYVFGYPRVPMTTDMAITVQRGEVVNPSAETIPDRQKIFLYSAIARPGNSGGPIVAQDGRVIGLVVEDSPPSTRVGATGERPIRARDLQQQIDDLESEVEELKARAFAPSFYKGIPSSDVVRALDELGYGGIIEMDTPR